MNDDQLKELLKQGKNLEKMFAICEKQESVSTKRLKSLLEDCLLQQKTWAKITGGEDVVFIPEIKNSSFKKGDYVFASRWSDADPDDPWIVGYVATVTCESISVKTDVKVSNRRWRNAIKISPEVGKAIIDNYPKLEGVTPEPGQLYAIFNP